VKKFIKLPVRFELTRYPGQAVFYISLGIPAIREWCLGLALLKDGLIDALVVSEIDDRYKIHLEIAISVARGKIHGNLNSGAVHIQLIPVDIAYLLAMCLKYYRDGYAEVDHVDIESKLEVDENAYVTVKFADYASSLSSEEAKKRLED
jgi:hypothetical protein